ncbi:MAG: PsiF family protein [Burkholderiales bacterium]
MRILISLIVLIFSGNVAFAAEDASTAQQARMKTCNQEAGDRKGGGRKAFMKECLSADKTTSQQDKMKSCNKDAAAKNLKGDERKKFMSDCLSA